MRMFENSKNTNWFEMVKNPKMIITKIDQFEQLPLVTNHQINMINAWKDMEN